MSVASVYTVLFVFFICFSRTRETASWKNGKKNLIIKKTQDEACFILNFLNFYSVFIFYISYIFICYNYLLHTYLAQVRSIIMYHELFLYPLNSTFYRSLSFD
ncbi:hypothetical protein PGIGA_G00219240 [Pangasianodon gigas]|uniref:Uncharacterized protein n=1 Tax=Pangasianodon gigas TaxID=30993 RepID=A0ACC5WI97_PANGG|nr:hypothetical protein [Pangasianodon gigas]